MVGVRREDVEHVAAHAERAARELVVVAVVLDLDEVADELRRGRSASPTSRKTAMPA